MAFRLRRCSSFVSNSVVSSSSSGSVTYVVQVLVWVRVVKVVVVRVGNIVVQVLVWVRVVVVVRDIVLVLLVVNVVWVRVIVVVVVWSVRGALSLAAAEALAYGRPRARGAVLAEGWLAA